ncbi:MAG: hypothetical protein QOF18_996 [Frankiaceae bacterium]|jgi:prepilin-type N-terminal cleavage/methylation domain-containing protein|nr:hypothetical protein [Frankiaceae bacterium]
MRRERAADDGYSLIEMLVVLALVGIVGGIISATMISGMRNTRQAQNRAYSASLVQTQLERISRDIRVADPIRAASANAITVDVYRTNTCVRRQWSVSSGALVSTSTTFATWSACAVYPATATPTSTVTSTVLPSLGNGSTPVFTYQNAAGAALSAPTVSQIAVVDVTLVQSGQENRGPVTLDTSVGVRNATLQ